MKVLAKGIIRKDGKVAENYRTAILRVFDAIIVGKPRIHGKSWTGSRKHRTLVDVEWKDMAICDALGIKYTHGNDAPKGGVEGDYIELKLDGRNRAIARVRKEWVQGLYLCSEQTLELFAEMVKGLKPEKERNK